MSGGAPGSRISHRTASPALPSNASHHRGRGIGIQTRAVILQGPWQIIGGVLSTSSIPGTIMWGALQLEPGSTWPTSMFHFLISTYAGHLTCGWRFPGCWPLRGSCPLAYVLSIPLLCLGSKWVACCRTGGVNAPYCAPGPRDPFPNSCYSVLYANTSDQSVWPLHSQIWDRDACWAVLLSSVAPALLD